MEPLHVLAQVQLQTSPSVVSGLIARLAGILILILHRILNYVVAFYLILVGSIQIFDWQA